MTVHWSLRALSRTPVAPNPCRTDPLTVSLLYVISIIGSFIGEQWAYHIIGSVIEVILLVAFARTAFNRPPSQMASS